MTTMSSAVAIVFTIGCLAIIPVNVLLSDKNTADSKKIPKDCSVCGITLQKNAVFWRILGGTSVKHANIYPWLVGVGYKHCTGAIIDAFYILTAAHCVMKEDKIRKVFFQSPSLNPKDSYAIATDKVIVHPSFGFVKAGNNSLAKYDIALVKLKQRIKCDEYKSPICLPDIDFKLSSGARSIIAGWGVTVFGYNDGPIVLRHGSVKHFDFEKCNKAVPGATKIKDHMLCEGGTKQLPCSGDSGSPLVHEIKQKYYAVGVSSTTTCDEDVNNLSLFTNVVKFLDWIKKEIKAPSPRSFPTERKKNQNQKYTGYQNRKKRCTGGRKKERKQNKNKINILTADLIPGK